MDALIYVTYFAAVGGWAFACLRGWLAASERVMTAAEHSRRLAHWAPLPGFAGASLLLPVAVAVFLLGWFAAAEWFGGLL